ncbi:LPXTG cell wall anchor domain-containing protein [Streptococcus halichoeri]|uniref:LPXTG cell wall anchor domain-containing protein n=1 Tax=Streptococcus halichoeri TaxID=254785 RepID=UPI001356930D|nr:LPXTG cell wall anchor domain-containing protein [Streptococcus halichoeri]
MSKKQLLLLTCVSTLALGNTVFAEDVVPVDPAEPSTEVVTPPKPVDPGLPTDTTDPSTPVDPGKPTDSTIPTNSSTSPTNPSDNSTKPGSSSTPTDSKPTDTTPTTKPTEKKPETPTPEVPSTVTPEVIDKVDKETGHITIKPIPISPNKIVVGTQNGNVIVQDSSGSHVVSATDLGGRINEDGTVTIKDAEGKEKTLPHTGEKQSIMFVLLGFLLTFGGLIGTRKTN